MILIYAISNKFLKAVLTVIVLGVIFMSSAWNQSVYGTELLIDFGPQATENQYGILGWDSAIIGPHTAYTTAGPGGTVQVSGSDKFDGYQGVQGTPRKFIYGERIVATWYNNSNEKITFQPLVTFEDPNFPNDNPGEPQWYPMMSQGKKGVINPHSLIQTTYDIADGSQYHSYPISAGTYSLVNICANTPEKALVLDKIEITHDVDTIAPQAPQNLRVINVSDTWVELAWDDAIDNVKTERYFLYRDGELEAVTTGRAFTDFYLAPQTPFTYTVTALDTNRNESEGAVITVTTKTYQDIFGRLNPWQDIEYRGAFKLPKTENGTWQNSHTLTCSAITFYPYPEGKYPETKDPGGRDDGYPGSLFAVGNWGRLGKGRIAEISIPKPVKSKNLEELPVAKTLQPFADVRAFDVKVQLPTIGLEYLPAQGSQQSDKLYHYYGEYYLVSSSFSVNKPVTHGASELTLSAPQSQGGWRIGPKNEAPMYDQYVFLDLFQVPPNWAREHIEGRMLITGRSSRTGARAGDAIYAIGPWIDSYPEPLPPDQSNNADYLQYVTLLEYDKTGTRTRNEFNPSDSFIGGSWLSSGEKFAILLSGTKALGDTWYGYADGSRPGFLEAHVPSLYSFKELGGKGHKCTGRQPLMLLYNPDDFAKVAHGELAPWEPQPYAGWDVSEYLLNGKKGSLKAITFDQSHGFLYAVEASAYNSYPVIHVFKVQVKQPL